MSDRKIANSNATLTFQNNDAFNRSKYSDFILTLVKTECSQEGSYTIAIDAPYGSGKTWFLHMLESRIKAEYGTTNKPLTAVYYDAWKYDYFGEALEPLVQQIMNTDELAEENERNDRRVRMRKILACIKSLGKEVKILQTVIAAFDAVQGIKEPREEKADELADYDQVISELQEALDEAAKSYGENGKLIVFIDELDRCRPDFAIKTLEVIKHLMASRRIVFIFAMDMHQLRRTIETTYGSGMDADGYLLRFFNYISVMPKASLKEYITGKFIEQQNTQHITIVMSELNRLSDLYRLTPRDIDRIVPAYQVMQRSFLHEYLNSFAYVLYLHLLTLKYKKRRLFDAILGVNLEQTAEIDQYYKYDSTSPINCAMRRLSIGNSIKLSPNNDSESFRRDNYIELQAAISKRESLSIHSTFFARLQNGSIVINMKDKNILYIAPEDTIFDDVIFVHDIKRLLQLKDREITYSKYVLQQLEMFEFSMPDEISIN